MPFDSYQGPGLNNDILAFNKMSFKKYFNAAEFNGEPQLARKKTMKISSEYRRSGGALNGEKNDRNPDVMLCH